MQTTSALYNQILSGNHYKNHKIVFNDADEYDSSYIVSASRSSSLFGSDEYPSVGGAVSAQFEVQLRELPKELPRSSKMQFYERVETKDGSQVSEWISQGVYFVSTRSIDSDGILEIHAYDSLLKGDRVLLQTEGDQSQWPKTDIQVINLILEDIGVELDTYTSTIINKSYAIQYPGYGEDGLTEREILGYIAGMYGGNFEISKDNKLRLVVLNSVRLTDVYNLSYSNTEYVSMGSARTEFTKVEVFSDEANYFAGSGTPSWTPNKTYAVGDYAIYEDITYKCIVAHTSGNTFDNSKWREYSSIDVRTFSVYTPWATQTIANNIFNIINGFEYQPYSVSNNVCGNAAIELGDKVVFPNGKESFVYTLDFTYDFATGIDFEGPMSQESDDEYPYVDKAERSDIRRQAQIDQIKTSLTVMDGKIEGVIEGEVRTFRGASDPYLLLGSSPRTGDLWYSTSNNGQYKKDTWYRSVMIAPWSAGTHYFPGNCVYTVDSEGVRSYHICITEHYATTEFDPTKWNNYAYSYLWEETTGQVNAAPPWEEETEYYTGDIVTGPDGNWYACKEQCKNVQPPNARYWEKKDYISDSSKSQILQELDSISLSVSSSSEGSSITLTAGGITAKSTGPAYFDTDEAHFTGKVSATKVLVEGEDANFIVCDEDGVARGYIGYGEGSTGVYTTYGVCLKGVTTDSTKYPAWQPYGGAGVGAKCTYNNKYYICTQQHVWTTSFKSEYWEEFQDAYVPNDKIYAIVTGDGVRLQAGENGVSHSIYVTKNGCYADGVLIGQAVFGA